MSIGARPGASGVTETTPEPRLVYSLCDPPLLNLPIPLENGQLAVGRRRRRRQSHTWGSEDLVATGSTYLPKGHEGKVDGPRQPLQLHLAAVKEPGLAAALDQCLQQRRHQYLTADSLRLKECFERTQFLRTTSWQRPQSDWQPLVLSIGPYLLPGRSGSVALAEGCRSAERSRGVRGLSPESPSSLDAP